MAYVLLLAGLVLALAAATKLVQKKKEPFDDALRAEVDRPLNRELVALFELQESVEAALAELDEKNQVFHHLVSRLEKQREAVEFRLQQLERLITRAEAVLNNPVNRAVPENGRIRHEQVYRLADEGKNVADVAMELGIGRGEVELILGLRK
jgi:paraquat-inducible protein B